MGSGEEFDLGQKTKVIFPEKNPSYPRMPLGTRPQVGPIGKERDPREKSPVLDAFDRWSYLRNRDSDHVRDGSCTGLRKADQRVVGAIRYSHNSRSAGLGKASS